MCEACGQVERSHRQRSKLADIDDTYHCSVVGTCLNFHDLDKLAKKSRLMFPAEAVPYQKHGAFVKAISDAPTLAKITGKYLDRKYSSAIRKSRQLRCKGDLVEYWENSLKSGDIPGPFWACLTHANTDSEFSTKLFGDIHMLSHLVGASNRADIKLLGELESERNRYRALFENTRSRMKRLVQQKNQTITLQEDVIAKAQRGAARNEQLQSRVQYLEAGIEENETSKNIKRLEEQLIVTTQQNSEFAISARKSEQLTFENNKLKEELALLHHEHDALETLTKQRLTDFCDTCDLNLNSKPQIDLDGSTIVYVGGRTGHIRNFKTLVKEANGEFLHHDGGIEDNDHRLAQLMSSGDIIMCPMDCVSHQASIRAKKFCKHAGKKFIPLRSSGFSTFVASLQEFSQGTE